MDKELISYYKNEKDICKIIRERIEDLYDSYGYGRLKRYLNVWVNFINGIRVEVVFRCFDESDKVISYFVPESEVKLGGDKAVDMIIDNIVRDVENTLVLIGG